MRPEETAHTTRLALCWVFGETLPPESAAKLSALARKGEDPYTTAMRLAGFTGAEWSPGNLAEDWRARREQIGAALGIEHVHYLTRDNSREGIARPGREMLPVEACAFALCYIDTPRGCKFALPSEE